MKLCKTSAAVFVALMAAGAGAQAGGTFQFAGDPTVYNWSGSLAMDTAGTLVPDAFVFSGSPVGFAAVGTGLHADDSNGGTFDFSNFQINYGSPIPLSNGSVTVNSLNTTAKTFDISSSGSPPFPFPTANFGMTGDYTTAAPPPVPIPAAVWLFGSAALGVAGLARRPKDPAAA